MLKNRKELFKTIVGDGEVPIEQLTDFDNDKSDRENVERLMIKNIKLDNISSLLLILTGAAFSAIYAYMYFNTYKNPYLLTASAIFAMLVLTSIYKIVVNKKIFKSVKNGKYDCTAVTIHHFMPEISIISGKSTVKIQDTKGNVYSYEFSLSRKLKKMYKKNPNMQFVVVSVQSVKKYFLFCKKNF